MNGLEIEDLALWEILRVRAVENTCRWILEQHDRMKAYKIAAEDLTTQLAVMAAQQNLPSGKARKVSAKSMTRIFLRWMHGERAPGGDWLAEPRTWQCLVDKRTLAAVARNCRTAQPIFRNFIAQLAAKHKRSLKSAHRELLTLWHTGQNIPGYTGLNYKAGLPVPAGWSYDNFVRCLPDQRTLTITRKGVREAFPMLPGTRSTRKGGWPCAIVVFDDVWLDCLAWGPSPNGKMQLGRPLQIGALDWYTGRRLVSGTKLRTLDESGQRLQLTAQEMLFVLVDYLHTVGYSERGTVLYVEHGTAAISDAIEQRLLDITAGKVQVRRPGIVGVHQPGSAFEGRGEGNFRFKTWLESWHNILHNYMDDQPLHTGHNRHEPETLHGIRRAQEQLIKQMNLGKLPHEIYDLLLHYAPSLYELMEQLAPVVSTINNRSDHNLEGWEECGFLRTEFCVTGTEWTPEEELAPLIRAAALAQAAQTPDIARRRRMSPEEAWHMETAKPENKLRRLSAAECCALLGPEMAFPLSMKNGYFEISAKKRHYAHLQYETRVINAWGREEELTFGEKYSGIFNPLSETLFVLDEKNRCLGEAMIANKFAQVDPEAAARAIGHTAHRIAEITGQIEAQMAPTIAAEQAQLDYNAAILAAAENPRALMPPAAKPAARKRANVPDLSPVEENYDLPISYSTPTFR